MIGIQYMLRLWLVVGKVVPSMESAVGKKYPYSGLNELRRKVKG